MRRTRNDKAEPARRAPDKAPGERQGLGNHLLGMLPPPVLARLQAHQQPVQLERKVVIFRAHERLATAYFPVTAVISFVAHLESGEQLEVGMVGRDGLAGTSVFPGVTTMSCDGVVQIPGLAQSMSADVLRRELLANPVLYSVVGRYAQLLMVRSMQLSVCNMFHTVEQRCIRWLLSLNDLMGHDDIPLTHELMATSLGVHRPTLTLALRSLHKEAFIEETRGRIVLLNRRGLEEACCECYAVMKDEERRLMGAGPAKTP